MNRRYIYSMVKKYHLLWWLLLLLLLVRLPSLNRPLSKHDDFNTAVILINAISWQQAGGGAQFYFTPFMNFQGEHNKILEQGHHIDKQGNQVYLSFGAGWYLLPYAISQLLQVPLTPLLLQWISIIVGIITVVMLYTFLLRSTGSSHTALLGTLLFASLPAVLWYTGISYVTTGIMLPLVIWILWLWWQLAQDAGLIRTKWLLQLSIATLLLTYIDWLSVFLVGSMVLWAMLNLRKNRRFAWVALVGALSVAAGVFFILWQYASYLGWPQVVGYWQSRFGERSTSGAVHQPWKQALVFIRFVAAGFCPLLLAIILLSVRFRKKLPPTYRWLNAALAGVAVYNMVFLNWSAEHEFAWLAMALIGCIYLSILYPIPAAQKWPPRWMLAYVSLGFALYFYINQPGPLSYNGTPYIRQQVAGQQVAASVPNDAFIFTNLPNAKIEEYYARRSFNLVGQLQQARHLADSLHLPKAYWVAMKNDSSLLIIPLQQLQP